MNSINKIRIRMSSLLVRLKTKMQPNYQAKIWQGVRGTPSSTDFDTEIYHERNRVLWKALDEHQTPLIIELGSGHGPNLIDYAKRNPKTKFFGLDINKSAVKMGNELAHKNGLENLYFYHFNIIKDEIKKVFDSEDLRQCVVFTWAVLIYIHPRDIKRVLEKILQMKPALFVLIEQHDVDLELRHKYGKMIAGGPNYVRDYEYLLAECDALKNYQIWSQPLSPDVWSPGGGKAHMVTGTLIRP